jgi:L-ascorbate metabolism protein UlaG (beta-lactamase superfamily)
MAHKQGAALIQQMDGFVVPAGSIALWWLGQMGIAVKGPDQRVVYIDPFLVGPLAIDHTDPTFLWGRAFPPPLAPHDVTNASLVLCSHEHGDHTSAETLAGIATASPQARIAATGWAQGILDEAGIAPERRLPMTTGVLHDYGVLQVSYIPAAHYSREHDPIRGHRWVSMLLDWGSVALFHGGDTIVYDGYIEAIQALPRADVGMLACNGSDAMRNSRDIAGNMMPAEAAYVATQAGWSTLIAGHNDLFASNRLPAAEVASQIKRVAPDLAVHAYKPGELAVFQR